eukprot:750609-Hanusia_phi.AAC.5
MHLSSPRPHGAFRLKPSQRLAVEPSQEETMEVNVTEAEDRGLAERQQNATNHEAELMQRVKQLEEKSIDDNQRLENARDEIQSLKQKILHLEESLKAQANQSAPQPAAVVQSSPSCGLRGLEEVLKDVRASHILHVCSQCANQFLSQVSATWEQLRVKCVDWFALTKLHLTTLMRQLREKLSQSPTPEPASGSS